MSCIQTSKRSGTSAIRRVRPAWTWVGWLFLGFTGLAFITGCIGLGPWTTPQKGLNFLTFISMAVTSLAVYLTIRIFRNQALQADVDSVAQAKLLSKIEEASSTAAHKAGSAADNTAEIIQLLNEAQKSKTHHRLSPEGEAQALAAYAAATRGARQVLWVDDNVDWIKLEQKMLESAGVATVWVPNTARALELLDSNSFGVVITDMARIEGDREGYALLDAMRERDDATALIVYSS